MTKLYFSNEKLGKKFFDELELGSSKIKEITKNGSVIRIPSTFWARSSLISVLNDIEGIEKEISEQKDLIEKTIKLYENTENKNCESTSLIKDINIAYRPNLIKK